MIKSILVVCLGNICRSPMAETLLREALPNCQIASAGLAPLEGAAADPRAVSLLGAEGSAIRAHRARTVNAALIDWADLVLVMDGEQRDEIEERFPQARGKVYRLCEFVHADVPDPFGCSQNMFSIVLGLIKQGIESWSVRIQATRNNVPANCHGEAS
jgi:protein-tyrosine phosphatase